MDESVKKREIVRYLITSFKISERRACRLACISRSLNRYQSRAKDQTALRMQLRDLAAARVRWGYKRLHILLRRGGWKVNHKRAGTHLVGAFV